MITFAPLMITKKVLGLLFLIVCTFTLNAQKLNSTFPLKGKFYAYWGWNSSVYSNSDIHFTGNNYDFTLYKVKAKDRQSLFSIPEYFGIQHFTIPQYNLRVGYYLSDKWDVSIAIDHMKYVMVDNQNAEIDGVIATSNPKYDSVYHHQTINVSTDFLTFEHTDGLNYVNSSIRRHFNVITKKNWGVSAFTGLGLGIMIPKSNVKLMANTRHDQFHLSGWGVDATSGLKLKLGKHFFIQTEIKGGYINMPDVMTTYSENDRASQRFTYRQNNIVFGLDFGLGKKKKVTK